MKKILFFLVVLTLLFPRASLADDTVDVYFFWANGCPHCAKESIFLDSLETKYGDDIDVHRFEVSESKENAELLASFGEQFDTEIVGVPFTVIVDEYFVGFYNDETTGAKIETKIASIIDNKPKSEDAEKVSLPIFGDINPQSFSLPLMTIILGFLDGFNPCAMWALLFLISLLLGMEDRKRMWFLGFTFIISSGAVYYLFMVAWLNLILFLGFIFWLRIIIGLVALGGGLFNLRRYFRNKNAGCDVRGVQSKKEYFAKLKKITSQDKVIWATLGIIALAFSVNLVELICSAGLPAVYSQILTINHLPLWQYYLYIFLYVLVFIIDDLLVFIIAMITLRVTGISTKYSRWSSLIGGILMLIIGILLIFKHEWLMFN